MNYILFYNGMWNDRMEFPDIVAPEGFCFTNDRSLYQDAVAVVFHMPSLPVDISLEKMDGQLWVFWSMECNLHYPLFMNEQFTGMFDLIMNYKMDADVPVPYIEYDYAEKLRQPPVPKTQFVNAFVSSRFNQSSRAVLLTQLMEHLPIDSYGDFLRNRYLKEDRGRDTKMAVISTYRFTLAFENAIDKDYVTEKLYDPLIAGSVPVYLGAPNIEEYLPGDHCCINASGFSSVKELAEYLDVLMNNDVLYERYLEWKVKPFRSAFLDRIVMKQEHPFVLLCKKVKQKLLI